MGSQNCIHKPEEFEASGFEYPCRVGFIHKRLPLLRVGDSRAQGRVTC